MFWIYINLPSFLALLSVPLVRWSPACREDLAPLVLRHLRRLQVVPWLRNHPDYLELPVAQERQYFQLLPLVPLVQCLHEIHLGLVGPEDLAFLGLQHLLDLHQTLGIQALPLDQEAPMVIVRQWKLLSYIVVLYSIPCILLY